jgi:hypothetical protein
VGIDRIALIQIKLTEIIFFPNMDAPRQLPQPGKVSDGETLLHGKVEHSGGGNDD